MPHGSKLYDRTGREIGHSRNLRGILDWSRVLGRNIRQVTMTIPATGDGALLQVDYMDGSFAVCDFASWTVCKAWVLARRSWNVAVTRETAWTHTAAYPAQIVFG